MTGLIRTPSIAASVFVLTEFDWIDVFVATKHFTAVFVS